LIIFIRDHAEIEIRTQTREYMIHIFAFATFSSSPIEMIYLTHASIREITAITAIYFIPLEMMDHRKLRATVFVVQIFGAAGFAISPSGHHGSPTQLTAGAAANTGERETQNKKRKVSIFFIEVMRKVNIAQEQ
jgi:hypothetical protein